MTIAAGTAAALYYAQAGLTNSHYDARAHLVVARRILDSLTPGWQQIGAVWLPLPHVLNMLPVQVDAWYRSGASGVALSVLSMGIAAWSLAAIILRTTGSVMGGMTAAALLLANPNVLYLQSTPMTEPLLFATTALSIAMTAAWLDRATQPGANAPAHGPGLAFVAACLTRYEAWPITAAAIALAGLVLLRRGIPIREAVRACVRLAAYPIVAIVIFTVNSRYTTGAWFSTDFFVPENVEALGRPMVALAQVHEGLYQVSGTAVVWSAYAGAVLSALAFFRSKARAPVVLVLALTAAATLPVYAYASGHPFRIRYDVPIVAACTALSGAFVALLWRPLRPFAAAVIILVAMRQSPPLDRNAPMVVEAQRDAANMIARHAVTDYLSQHYDGRTILISMGSLAHYMHDLSHAGFSIHDFLHEGNGKAWPFALLRARTMAGWVVIEEHAEGGDALYWQSKRNHRFLDGFERVAEGGNVALYRLSGRQ